MAGISPKAAIALEKIMNLMLSVPPFSLGFPNKNNQSNYYPRTELITKNDIAKSAKVIEKHTIKPENTRLRKIMDSIKSKFKILLALTETNIIVNQLDEDGFEAKIYIRRGDHAAEMSKICSSLNEATKYTASDK